jgi:hypothetical protein
MYLSNLGFFKEKAELKEKNRLNNLNLLTAKLKNNTLRRMLCAYLQQELQALVNCNISREAKAKQKRLLVRLKLRANRRRSKERITLRLNHTKTQRPICH